MYKPTATATTIATSPPPTSRRRRVTGRRMAGRAQAPGGARCAAMASSSPGGAAGQQLPEALRHLRELEAEGRLVQLAGPLRGAGADHDPAPEAERDERGLARVASRLAHPARRPGQAAGGLEDREVADEAGHALEQTEAVLEHGERRGARPDRLRA